MTLLRAIALRVPGAAGGAPCSKPAYKERCCTRATRPSQRRSVGSASIGWVDQTLKLLVSDGFAKAASRSFACRMASTRAACRTCSLSSAFIEHQRYFVLLSHQQRSVKQHCSCCLKRSKWFCYFDDDQGRYAMLLLPNIP